MNEIIKREIILDNYKNPFHKEKKEEYELQRANNPHCIDDINLYIKINGDVLEDLSFDGEACVISTSATSIMIKELIGKRKEEVFKIIDNFIAMLRNEEYSLALLGELIVYETLNKQANRITCGLLPFINLKKYLEERWK